MTAKLTFLTTSISQENGRRFRTPRQETTSSEKVHRATLSDHERTCVSRLGTKRTVVTNFGWICEALDRSLSTVSSHAGVETGAQISTDPLGRLIAIRYQNSDTEFSQLQIDTIVKNYIRDFVRCKQCQGYSTELFRENRLNFVKCKTCHSTHSVAS